MDTRIDRFLLRPKRKDCRFFCSSRFMQIERLMSTRIYISLYTSACLLMNYVILLLCVYD